MYARFNGSRFTTTRSRTFVAQVSSDSCRSVKCTCTGYDSKNPPATPVGLDLESRQRAALGAARCRLRAATSGSDDTRAIKDRFAEELPSMLPLPLQPFRAAAADAGDACRGGRW